MWWNRKKNRWTDSILLKNIYLILKNFIIIGNYSEYEEYAIWNYILDDEMSDEILVIATDKNGEIVDIT